MRECIKDISYVPAREGSVAPNPDFSGLRRVGQDKDDYYQFGGRKFKTSEDAMRACVWS